MRRSAGLMVNYVYRLDDLERNHEAYARERRIIAARRFGVLAKDSLLMRGGAASACSPPKPRCAPESALPPGEGFLPGGLA